MNLQFRVTFKFGPRVVAEATGIKHTQDIGLTVEDVYDNIIKTEQFLERLTGLRVHIEQVG